MAAESQGDHVTKMADVAVQTGVDESLSSYQPSRLNLNSTRRCLSLSDFSQRSHSSDLPQFSPACQDCQVCGLNVNFISCHDDDWVSGSASTSARLHAMLHAVHGFIDDFRKHLEQLTHQAEIREAELKRLHQERVELRTRLFESRARNSEMTSIMNDLQLCLNDLQSKYDENVMMAHLKQAEHSSTVTALNTKLRKLSKENRRLVKMLCTTNANIPSSRRTASLPLVRTQSANNNRH